MALAKQDKEWVLMTARQLVYDVLRVWQTEHIKGCPWGQKLRMWRALVVGVGIGVGIIAGGSIPNIIRGLFLG